MTDKKWKLPKLKEIKKIYFIAGAVVLLTIIAAAGYFTSPGYKANRQLKLGEKYLAELDYEQAVIAFQKAIEIAPDNETIRNAVYNYLDAMCQTAREHGAAREYGAELEIAACVLKIEPDYISGKLAEGEGKYGSGNFEEAENIYINVLELEPENEEALEGRIKSELFLMIFKCYREQKWRELGKIIQEKDSVYKELLQLMDDEETITYILPDENIVLQKKENSSYLYCGDYEQEKINGEGTAIILAENVNAIYTGGWKDGYPDGTGRLSLWGEKNPSFSMEANQEYQGKFVKGTMDGKMETFISTDAISTGLGVERVEKLTSSQNVIRVSKGSVQVFKTDESNALLLEETAETYMLAALYEKEKEGKIENYVAGVPLFGGDDRMLYYALLDRTPPVLTCSKEVGRVWDEWDFDFRYDDFYKAVYEEEINAVDNVDGNISDRIVVDMSGWDAVMSGDGEVHYSVYYSVKDSSGNEAFLEARFKALLFCAYSEVTFLGIVE